MTLSSPDSTAEPFTLQDLSDRAQIADLALHYAYAIDAKDWATWESLFTPDASVDYTSAGGIAGTPAEIAKWLPDALAAYTFTQHSVSTHRIELAGDEATGSAHVFSRHGMEIDGKVEFLDVGGIYEDRYVRTQQGWRFCARTENTLWFAGGVWERLSRARQT